MKPYIDGCHKAICAETVERRARAAENRIGENASISFGKECEIKEREETGIRGGGREGKER